MIKVREMERADVGEVHAIHCACLTRTLAPRYTSEQIDAWMSGRTPEGYWRAVVAGEHYLVAENDGSVVAFASWEDDELLALFVHPDFQGRGHGSRLLNACIADAERGVDRLKKVKAALGAEDFYSHHGFHIDGHGDTEKLGVAIPDIRMSR
jgi:GNAT superfamily N-acetyltransferase